MKSIIYIFILIFGLNIQSIAQDSTNVRHKFKHSLGAAAGFTTGYGLSYRFQPTKFGIQGTFAPFKSETTSRISLGVTFTYDLIQTQYTRLYLYQGNHFYRYKYSYTNTYYDPYYGSSGYNYYTSEFKETINSGLGFGLEVLMAKRIGWNFMTGYAFYDNFKQLNLTVEGGLYYKF